MHNIFIYTAQY